MALTLDDDGRLVDTIDPNADLDYELDLTDWLTEVNDTLASLTVIAVNCTVHNSGIVGNRVRTWVTAAVLGKIATVTFRFTTTNAVPRTNDRTIYLTVVKK